MGDRLFPPGLRAYLRALTFFMVLWFGISLLVRIPLLLPSPVVVSQEFLRTAVSGEAWRQISVSLRRLASEPWPQSSRRRSAVDTTGPVLRR